MIKNVITNIGDVGLYGIISICLFFLVFVGILVWALTMKKSKVKKMSRLPLEDDDFKDDKPKQGNDHHE